MVCWYGRLAYIQAPNRLITLSYKRKRVCEVDIRFEVEGSDIVLCWLNFELTSEVGETQPLMVDGTPGCTIARERRLEQEPAQVVGALEGALRAGGGGCHTLGSSPHPRHLDVRQLGVELVAVNLSHKD